jgi:aminopeptidase N
MFLARHDSDLFCRWQALTGMLTETLDARNRQGARRKIGGGNAEELVELCIATWDDGSLEPAFRALALTLPVESEIAREIGSNIDPDAILAARNSTSSASVARNGATVFAQLYAELADTAPIRQMPKARWASRSLRNTLLDFLAVGSGRSRSWRRRTFDTATNMTDLVAALTILSVRFTGSDATAKALADLRKPLWRQSAGDGQMVSDSGTCARTQSSGPGRGELLRHPAYDASNPNRVRALVGAFSTANQTGFHQADGSGYRLLAETVLDAETRNPQLAARLATAFRSWRSTRAEPQGKGARDAGRHQGAAPACRRT